LGAYVIGLTKRRRDAVVEAIQVTCTTRGLSAVQQVINGLQPPPVDRGTYRQRFKVRMLKTGAAIYNSLPYAPVIEWGRRAGAKMPPPAALVDWVIRKGLVPRVRKGKSGKGWTVWDQREAAMQIAWMIARAIQKRGQPARAVLSQAGGMITSAVCQAAQRAAAGLSY
jgi:hypothetical protein